MEKGLVTRKDAPLLRREESGTVYLSSWYKGLPIPLNDDQRIGLNFNFAEEFRKIMNVRRFLGIEIFFIEQNYFNL